MNLIYPPDAIDLQFVRGTALSSRLIAWYGNGYGGFSHVDAVLHDGMLAGARSDAVGGKPPGFQIREPNYESWDKVCRLRLSVDPTDALRWETWLRDQINAPYDTGAIWGFILGHDDHDNGHWICSAAQTGALQQIGRLPELLVPDSQITPNSLSLMLQAQFAKSVFSI